VSREREGGRESREREREEREKWGVREALSKDTESQKRREVGESGREREL
jgi:hypothetical protein